jgi:hypothetical protein
MNDQELKDLLAQALAEYYHQEYLEDPEDPESRRYLLRELNQSLDAWGLSHLAQVDDLQKPDQLAALLVESPAAEVLLQELPNRVRQWASRRPPPGRPPEDQAHWLEQARALWNQARLEGQA